MFNLQAFLDLINSKYCTHEYNILNFSDLKKVDKTFFKNTKYYKKIACDLGFAATNCSWIFAPGGRSWQPLAAPGSYKAHILHDFWNFCPWRASTRHNSTLQAATKLIFCMRGFMDMLNSILILPEPQID